MLLLLEVAVTADVDNVAVEFEIGNVEVFVAIFVVVTAEVAVPEGEADVAPIVDVILMASLLL